MYHLEQNTILLVSKVQEINFYLKNKDQLKLNHMLSLQ